MSAPLRNIWVVFRSEFMRRVRTKAFILTTLLVPFGFLALIGVGVVVGIATEGSNVEQVAVLDETGVLASRLSLPEDAELVPVQISPDSLRAAVRAETFDVALILPASLLDGTGEAEYLSRSGGTLFREAVRDRVARAVEDERLDRLGAPAEVRAVLDSRVSLRAVRVDETGEANAAGGEMGGTALGMAMGFLIYLAVLLYGSFVMQSVLEEKTNRVVEVMVSSVRPFHLLMGKVLAMGAVGLTQMLVWIGLAVGVMAFAGPIAAAFMDPATAADPEAAQAMMQMGSFLPANLATLLVSFALFFLGGYLLYSSLFAAAGSAIEQMQDAQSFTLPIMIPIILAFVFMTPVMQSPDSALAVILSMVPFFSPILMLVRMSVTSVPLWQVALSFLLLAASFVAAIWVSARIYRIGILMYGKKPSLRDLARWVRYA